MKPTKSLIRGHSIITLPQNPQNLAPPPPLPLILEAKFTDNSLFLRFKQIKGKPTTVHEETSEIGKKYFILDATHLD